MGIVEAWNRLTLPWRESKPVQTITYTVNVTIAGGVDLDKFREAMREMLEKDIREP